VSTSSENTTVEGVEAAVFRRLVHHLQERTEVQNIDLMLLANCLSQWYREEAAAQGLSLTEDEAKQRVYGMSYAEWKTQHQLPVPPEKLAAFKAKQAQRDE
jgi:hypothetical protein